MFLELTYPLISLILILIFKRQVLNSLILKNLTDIGRRIIIFPANFFRLIFLLKSDRIADQSHLLSSSLTIQSKKACPLFFALNRFRIPQSGILSSFDISPTVLSSLFMDKTIILFSVQVIVAHKRCHMRIK